MATKHLTVIYSSDEIKVNLKGLGQILQMAPFDTRKYTQKYSSTLITTALTTKILESLSNVTVSCIMTFEYRQLVHTHEP